MHYAVTIPGRRLAATVQELRLSALLGGALIVGKLRLTALLGGALVLNPTGQQQKIEGSSVHWAEGKEGTHEREAVHPRTAEHPNSHATRRAAPPCPLPCTGSA